MKKTKIKHSYMLNMPRKRLCEKEEESMWTWQSIIFYIKDKIWITHWKSGDLANQTIGLEGFFFFSEEIFFHNIAIKMVAWKYRTVWILHKKMVHPQVKIHFVWNIDIFKEIWEYFLIAQMKMTAFLCLIRRWWIHAEHITKFDALLS